MARPTAINLQDRLSLLIHRLTTLRDFQQSTGNTPMVAKYDNAIDNVKLITNYDGFLSTFKYYEKLLETDVSVKYIYNELKKFLLPKWLKGEVTKNDKWIVFDGIRYVNSDNISYIDVSDYKHIKITSGDNNLDTIIVANSFSQAVELVEMITGAADHSSITNLVYYSNATVHTMIEVR